MTNDTIHKEIKLILLFFALSFIAAPATAEKEISHGNVSEPQVITEDMKCPVCGMYPAVSPKWHSQVHFNDGTFLAFDGCKDMFKFLLHISSYDKKHAKDDVNAVFVKDFHSGKWINALDTYFVAGSNVLGPMGKQLIPFSDNDKAMEFINSNGGEMIRYNNVTMDTIKALDNS